MVNQYSVAQTIAKNEFLGTDQVINNSSDPPINNTPILTPDDDWSYTASTTNGQVEKAANSLELINWWDNNISVSFDQIDISAYTGVEFSIEFASDGNPHSTEDLVLEYSYFNGGSWVINSQTLITATNSTTTDIVNFGDPSASFLVSIPDTATLFEATISASFNAANESGGYSHEIYYIDNVFLSAIPALDPVGVDDSLDVLLNSSAGAANQIDVSTNDNIGTSDGTDGDDFSINTGPTNGTVTEVSDGVFEYIPDLDYVGSDSFTYDICDANDDCDTATVNVNVGFDYCDPNSNSTSPASRNLYITSVFLDGEATADINNTSGDNGGYFDFTASVAAADVLIGSTYPITIDADSDPTWVENQISWSVYIDLNQDGDFDDLNETQYQSATQESKVYPTRNITIPATATPGITVMRVAVQRWIVPTACSSDADHASEYEDYLLDLQIDPSAPQEIDVTGNNTAIADGALTPTTTNHTDFGTWDIFSDATTRTYTISNNGGLDLVLSGAVTVTPSTDFTISVQPADTTLSISESTTFTVSFNPTTAGLKQATVSIGSDDADEDPFTFLVEGYGEQTFPDTDNDGIPDNVDIDDDNDGLLDITEQLSCASNTVATTTDVVYLNEDFGSGTTRETISGASYCFEDGTGSCGSNNSLVDGEYVAYYQIANDNGDDNTPTGDLGSWADEYWYPGLDHTTGDTNGRMAIFNASYDPDVFYETLISGVSAGVDITYGFSAINIDRADAPGIATRERPSVLIEILDPFGVLITSSSSGDIEPTTDYVTGDWVDVSATFSTIYTQFTVRLSNENTGGLGNDLAIDDIFVLQTLCDLDGDGVEDSVDLDNDDDGVPNVVELQLTDDDKDGTVDNDSGAYAWVDVNNNGLLDLYDPQDSAGRDSGDVGFTGSVGTQIDLSDPIYDTDGDGVLDYLDLDSDNDGIFDTVEYDNRGDVDVDGDGNGDGIDKDSGSDDDDADGDGILGLADNNDDDVDDLDHGTGNVYPTPIDDDGDGIPNFRDVDSDDNPNDFSNGSDIDKTEIYAYLDANNDGVLDDTVDTDGDGILDIFDTDDTIFGSPRDLDGSYTLFFDGRNDYIEDTNVINGWADATLMAWIKIEPGSTGQRYIMGQDDFHLRLEDGNSLTTYANTTLTTNPLSYGTWVHVASTYSSVNGTVQYINGEIVNISGNSGGLPIDVSTFTIGKQPDTDLNYFEGEIDEVRVFSEALTADEIQKMVYQELDEANDFNRGKIIPLDIATTFNTSLIRYFKMDAFSNDIIEDKTATSTTTKIYNIKDIYFQTAPLPYETTGDGTWDLKAIWVNGDVWDIDDEANNKDWSIINIKHNITTSNSRSTAGLIIDSGKKLEINGDSELQNTWYLSLNGEIDLQGESQLVQTENSILVATGTLEKDQQGTENLYTYNYWSSPVHTTNPNSDIDGDESYTVAGVLMNGEDPDNPESINFIGGENYDGDSTSDPIEIADYWIWKYSNLTSDIYSLWQHVRSTGELLVGEGYTMKGPGTSSIDTNKNYVFTGIPNNGEINLYTGAGNDYLVGNPYPSAIDGSEFLNDNPHLSGTLYFWEHYGGGSHILKEYQGGYGMYNYSGGVPAINGIEATSDPDVDQTGSGTKIPKRYIPVGQGFFVTATSDGNTKFENDQRIFVTEAGGTNSLFIKSNNSKKEVADNIEDKRPKLRIGYKSPKGYERQLLVTVDENASLEYDWGYEGVLIEANIEDMFWKLNDENFIIQGIGKINPLATVLPLGIKTENGGIVEITIDELENVSDDLEIYLRDNNNASYHDLRNSNYITSVIPGDINGRFDIVFSKTNELSIPDLTLIDQTNIFYKSLNNSLVVINPNNYEMKELKITNTLGQMVLRMPLDNSQNRFEIPVNLIAGIYIVEIGALNFKTNQKIIVKK